MMKKLIRQLEAAEMAPLISGPRATAMLSMPPEKAW